MAWVITHDRDAKNVAYRYLIKGDGSHDALTKGEIVQLHTPGKETWQVNLLMVPDLTFKSHSREQCIGYVRGVEKTVELYAVVNLPKSNGR